MELVEATAAVIREGTAPKPICTPKLCMCASYWRLVLALGVMNELRPLILLFCYVMLDAKFPCELW